MPLGSWKGLRQGTTTIPAPPPESVSNIARQSTTEYDVASRAVALALAEIGDDLLRDGRSVDEAGAFHREAHSMSSIDARRLGGRDPWKPFVTNVAATSSTTPDRTTGHGMIGKLIGRCHGAMDCDSTASSTSTDDYTYDTDFYDDITRPLPCGLHILCHADRNETEFRSGLREMFCVMHGPNESTGQKEEVTVFEGGSDRSIPTWIVPARGQLYEI
jgi:hypothetical protein